MSKKHLFTRRIGAIILSAAVMLSVLCGGMTTANAEEAKSSVPKIKVVTDGGNGTSLEKADGYVPAKITISDSDGYELSDKVNFKVRGNTTALSWVKKKAYTFKFEKKKDVLGMGKGKKWALIANTFDPTLLRSYIAFNTAQELEIPFTSNQKYAEVWVDETYVGCYILYEPTQAGKDRVDIDIDGNDGKKDFLIEYELSREEEDVTYFKADGLRFISSEPEEPTEEQLSYITSTMTDIFATMKNGTQEEIAQKVDLSSFVKFYLLNEYIKTFDFSMSSVFFYYKDGILYAGPPWDYDLSAGNSNSGLSDRCTRAADPTGVYANSNIYRYLYNKDWFKTLVRDEYEKHYTYFKNIHADGGLMDTLLSDYGDLFNRNYTDAGWNVSKWWINISKKPLPTYQENFDYLKDWYSQRSSWFETYFKPFSREYRIGDANGDGKIDINDVTLIQKYLAMVDVKVDDYFIYRANVTHDDLTVVDATEIQRFLSHFPNKYGINNPAMATLPH